MLADSALSLFPILYFLNLLSSGIEAEEFSCPSVKIWSCFHTTHLRNRSILLVMSI